MCGLIVTLSQQYFLTSESFSDWQNSPRIKGKRLNTANQAANKPLILYAHLSQVMADTITGEISPLPTRETGKESRKIAPLLLGMCVLPQDDCCHHFRFANIFVNYSAGVEISSAAYNPERNEPSLLCHRF